MRLAALSACLLAGCATYRPAPPDEPITVRPPFDEIDAANRLLPGFGSIRGSGFLRQNGGGIVTCAGSRVYLIPHTAYAEERMRIIYGNADRAISRRFVRFTQPDDSAYLRKTRGADCDAQGRFEFRSLSQGSYFLTTLITWRVGYADQGGYVMRRVDVTDTGQLDVSLTAP